MNSPDHGESSPLTVTSDDLTGGTFPREFTCDGGNRRPRLQWSTPPPGTQELAIELLDPDAPGGTFTHWLAYGIPPGITSLATVPAGAAEGVNDFGRRGYGGPCPPRGAAHHYHFVVLALDTRLGLAAGATRRDLESRTRGHVLGQGELIATYQRGLTRQKAQPRPAVIERRRRRSGQRSECLPLVYDRGPVSGGPDRVRPPPEPIMGCTSRSTAGESQRQPPGGAFRLPGSARLDSPWPGA